MSTRAGQMLSLAVMWVGLTGLAAAALWEYSVASPELASARQIEHRDSLRVCGRTHVFREEETLERIADQELGDPNKWFDIRLANRQMLDVAPNGLEPGTALFIPIRCPD